MPHDNPLLVHRAQVDCTHHRNKSCLLLACCLLHITNCSMKRYKRSLTRHFLKAGKMLIPRHWKSNRTPTIAKWLHMIEEIYNMEETVAIAKECIINFHKVGTPWLMFRYSDQYTQLATE